MEVVKKSIAFLKAHATSLVDAETYLKKRGYAVISFLDPQELIDFSSKYSPNYLFLAFDHPHRSLPLLNSVLREYIEYPIAYYSESGSVATELQMEMQKEELEIIQAASGPQFERWMAATQKKLNKNPDLIRERKAPPEKKQALVKRAQQALTRQVNLYTLYGFTEFQFQVLMDMIDIRFYGETVKNLNKQSLLTRILVLSTIATTKSEDLQGDPTNDKFGLLTFESASQSGFCLVEGVGQIYLQSWQKCFEKGFLSAQENFTFRGPTSLQKTQELTAKLERTTEISVEFQGIKIYYLSSWDHPLGIVDSPLAGFKRIPLTVLPVQFPLTFNLYIHLERPDEALLYVPHGLKILPSQIERLRAKNIHYGLIKTEDLPLVDALFLTKRIEPIED